MVLTLMIIVIVLLIDMHYVTDWLFLDPRLKPEGDREGGVVWGWEEGRDTAFTQGGWEYVLSSESDGGKYYILRPRVTGRGWYRSRDRVEGVMVWGWQREGLRTRGTERKMPNYHSDDLVLALCHIRAPPNIQLNNNLMRQYSICHCALNAESS